MRSLATLAPAVVTVLLLAACGGGGAEVQSRTNVRGQTIGQELIDLQRARDGNLISQQEYDRQRQRILNGQ